jgi:chaperone modulatory protein CbpM
MDSRLHRRNWREGAAGPAASVEVVEARVYGAAALCAAAGISRATLRRFRESGIVAPARGAPRRTLYDEAALVRARTARRLMHHLGVNLAGAGVALRLLDELAAVRDQLAAARTRLRVLEHGAN